MQPEPVKSEALRQVEALYHAALRLTVSERPAFVEHACAGNETLKQEVQSLLSAHDRAEGFIESPALEIAADLYGGKRRPSRIGQQTWIGQQIGRYRILDAVGAGGMGEVYRAQDPRLDREVAIKILPARVADDPTALTRFKREAQAVAALSHPNILALHDFDTDGDTHFAVMELLEGDTVSQRLSTATPSTAKMDWRAAVEVAVAVADGLAAAHKKGIVHRDIKPSNIFLTSDGHVKILDFGIARVSMASKDATQTQATLPGLAIGTVGYMAPEQLRGETVEAPADVFSLGCVLHEMVTGKQAFVRNTIPDTVAAILTADPPTMGNSAQGVPLELEQVVQRCLRKQAAERFQSALDLAQALRQIAQGTAPVAMPVRKPSRLWLAALVFAAAVVSAAGAWLLRPMRQTPASYTDSLAILPIANQSGDPELEYVSDGITESLINRLSQLPRLKVIARTTAFRYKGRNVDIQQAGNQLQVRRVFTGRLVRQGDFLGVQVDLVNVADGSQVWGNHYNQKLSELITLPETLAGKISESLQLKLNGAEQKRLGRRGTENQDAYRLYLLGRFYWNQRSQGVKGTVEKAITQFQQAIDKDPLYALAYVGMAEAYATLPGYSDIPAKEASLKAKSAARKALEIDDTVSEAHVTLASVAADEWDWAGADKAFRRALELNPGYATAHQWYGEYLEKMGRIKEGLAETQRAYELDPLSPVINTGVGSLLYDDQQNDRALDQFRKALELNPDYGMDYLYLGLIRISQGKFKEAIAELEHARALMPGSPPFFSLIGYAQTQLGNRQAALDMIRQIADPALKYGNKPFDLAVLYLGLRDNDRVFEYLNQAVDQRAPLIERVLADPLFAPLRSDPRYKALLRRMNFPV